MKILHIADCHLDSAMEQHLDKRVAKMRRRELLMTFSAAIAGAKGEGASLVLIAGDLFDTPTPSPTALRYVLDCVAAHSDMTFIYIEGNHDIHALKDIELPENLHLVPAKTGRSFTFGEVYIHAAGYGAGEEVLSDLISDKDGTHIFLLHGILTTSRTDTREEMIPRFVLDRAKIDYLALGHFHTYTAMRLASGGLACYAGIPEGRGFDETGRCGVILYDTDKKEATFVHTAVRTLHHVEVDISAAKTLPMIEEMVLEATKEIAQGDMVRLLLKGEVEDVYLKDAEQIKTLLSNRFFFSKVKDSVRLHLRADRYRNDISLRGEFVRRVQASADLTEEDKERILAFGLRALEGEMPEDKIYP